MSTATTNRLNGTSHARPNRTDGEPAESKIPNGILEPDREWTNREIVDDAFNRGALGNAITPERLFIESRFRGLTDREVKVVLMEHEAVGFGDEGFKAAVSGDGQYFIQRIAAGDIENASMRELLSECADEIETPKAVRQNFQVADELRAKGIELNEREAVLLQTCHTMSKGFRSGTAILTSSLKRVLVNYHPEHFERRSQVSSVLSSLACRKVIGIGGNQVRLRDPLKQPVKRSPSKWARLTDDAELELILIACSDCMPCGFKRRNVAQRGAVRCLMEARHHITRKEVNRRIRILIEAGVLETTISKGAEALRLTVEASSVMRAKASELTAAEPKGIAKDETLNRYDDRNGCHIEAGRKDVTTNHTPAKSTAPRTDSKSIIQLLIQAIRLVERRA